MPASAPIGRPLMSATCRTERGAHCREEQRAVQDPRRHGVPDTDSVPDEIAKSGGCGNHRDTRDRLHVVAITS